MQTDITVPVDVYESPQETVIMLPLGGVEKSSVELYMQGHRLIIQGERVPPSLKPNLAARVQQCFRGTFKKEVQLSADTALDRIHSELSPDNILTIIVPKIIPPENMIVDIL